MSIDTPKTCGVPAGEQCDVAGVPDDHEQSGSGVMDFAKDHRLADRTLTR